MAPLIETKINDLANAIDDIAGQLGDVMQNMAGLQFGLQRNDDSWQMWLPTILKASQDAKVTKENLDQLQIGWPLRVIQGALGEITIEQEYLNFHIIQSGGTTVDVYGGSWDRNGVELAMTVDTGKTYKRLSLSSDGTWYIYLALESATKDPSLVPDTLTATASLVNPANEYNVGTYKILGTAVVANGVIKPLSITPSYYGGNIFDYWLVPDADSVYDAAGGRRYCSLETSPRGGRHEDVAQIYGFDNPDLAIPTATELIPFRKLITVGPGDTYYAIYWATPAELLENIDWGSGGGGSGIGGEIGDWLNTNTYIKHNKLDFTAGTIPDIAYTNTDHDERYPTPDTPTENVDANAGIFSFTNATVATAGAGAMKLSGGIYIAKNIIADATDVASATSGAIATQGGGYFGAGLYTIKGGSAQAAFFDNSAGETIALSGSNYCADMTGNGFSLTLCGTSYTIDGTGTCNMATGFAVGTVLGATYTAGKVQLPLAGGGFWEGYIRGGILTAT